MKDEEIRKFIIETRVGDHVFTGGYTPHAAYLDGKNAVISALEALLPPTDPLLDTCPCCGGTAELAKYYIALSSVKEGWFVRCLNCEMIRTANPDVGCSKKSAAACWNRRV